jgi:hypothetical protein
VPGGAFWCGAQVSWKAGFFANVRVRIADTRFEAALLRWNESCVPLAREPAALLPYSEVWRMRTLRGVIFGILALSVVGCSAVSGISQPEMPEDDPAVAPESSSTEEEARGGTITTGG